MVSYLKEVLNVIRLNFVMKCRKIRQRFHIKTIDVEHLHKTVKCQKEWYGSAYGGFYINPKLLDKNSVIYSFGIGKDITFDMKCIRKHHCTVFGFDPTPKAINYIKSRKISDRFIFFDYAVSPKESKYIDFYMPADNRGVSGSLIKSNEVDDTKVLKVFAKSFEDIANDLGHKHIDVVKIDIEGAEYELLDTIIHSSISVDQILVEFHDRMFNASHVKSKLIVKRMIDKGFEVFAHSINFEEVSFIKKEILRL